MGPRHSREQLLDAALDVARTDGLSRLTFGRVARHAGTSDRVVVYYFPDAAALVTAVLEAVGAQLQEVLGRALGGPAVDHRALVRAAWPVVSSDDAEPVFRLLFEAIGLAVAGREPYAGLAGGLTTGWVGWMAALLDGDEGQAAAALALIDGLVLLRLLAGPAAADAAAARLDVG
ncbi:hypothetical protein GCM10027047_35250 [Rhodococcus aerolatus]